MGNQGNLGDRGVRGEYWDRDARGEYGGARDNLRENGWGRESRNGRDFRGNVGYMRETRDFDRQETRDYIRDHRDYGIERQYRSQRQSGS